jgi:nicotinate-nucleotide adenylyltransferase
VKSSKARIGVFGGSFDPVHIGHLLVAETAIEQLALSRVLFMPTNIQPFKQDVNVTPADDRVRMLRLATKSNPRFAVSTIETDRAGVSYTIDSLHTLRERTGNEIVFLLGADMLKMIGQWSRASELLSEFSLAVGLRPGTNREEVTAHAETLRAQYGTVITFLDNIPINISSTALRARMKNGESVRYLIADPVRIYLEVRRKEGERRFAHTKRVMDLAETMAKRFGEDPEKARLAALLHDYEKDPVGGMENDLSHGPMAAEAAKHLFAVHDENVLNAIRWHTTGRAGMSRLELIIFLADTVEPGRTYDSIGRLRDNCLDDLERGAMLVLIELKKYLEKKGIRASADTEAAIADLKARQQQRQPQKGGRYAGIFGRRNSD